MILPSVFSDILSDRSDMSRRAMLRWSAMAGGTVAAGLSGGGALAAGTVRTQFGVNYYDLFYRLLGGGGAFDPAKQLQPIVQRKLRIIRFAAGPLWARDWTKWNADPERYLGQLDRLFDVGDRLGLRLIPVVMNGTFGLSDSKGEPFSAWGDPDSATRRAMAEHVPAIVRRYKARPSLFMWEFSNEMNAFVNSATGYKYYPPVDAVLRKARGPADNYSSADVESAFAHFVALVRQEDGRHPVESGSSIPNPREISGSRALDSRADMMQAMTRTLAGNSNTLSVHLYDDAARSRFDAKGSTFEAMLGMARIAADRSGAKLYLGEFGVPRSGNEAKDKARFGQMVKAIKAVGVDYATVWCYDWKTSLQWSITPDNGRLWMLDVLAANQ